MSSDDVAISVTNLSKCYQIYDSPRDRLKQFVAPRLQRIAGKAPQQYFREFWALKDVSFEVKKGETIGIIGRNGSGKSTLLQMICGTLNPTRGNIQCNGRIAALLELGSGFNPEFTGRENVYMNASVLGLSNEEIDMRFNDIVAFADIGDFIEQPVKTYSSGMMVRLAFAVIAHVDADILVIDEALAVGDAFFTQKCMRFLRNFMASGTVLFVSHDTAAIKNFCNRAIWIESGRILQQGRPKDVCEQYLEAYYESARGNSSSTRLKPRAGIHDSEDDQTAPAQKVANVQLKMQRQDQRQQFINASNLRNDLQIFTFNPDSPSFGQGSAKICNVQLQDEHGRTLAWIVGGEKVGLKITVQVYQAMSAPIVGFSVKDRLGQVLFGDNTYLTHRHPSAHGMEGGMLIADFWFYMPLLPVGEYSIAVAIADGTQENHVQHHWIHDAIGFKSESSSVSTGLVGIPMLSVQLRGAPQIANQRIP